MQAPSSPACPSRASARPRPSIEDALLRQACFNVSSTPWGRDEAACVLRLDTPRGGAGSGPAPRCATRSARPSRGWRRCPTTRARRWRCATASSCWATPSTSSAGRSTPWPRGARPRVARVGRVGPRRPRHALLRGVQELRARSARRGPGEVARVPPRRGPRRGRPVHRRARVAAGHRRDLHSRPLREMTTDAISMFIFFIGKGQNNDIHQDKYVYWLVVMLIWIDYFVCDC
jgi:hypothetical protein